MARSMISRGSVVLVRYPFTDLTGAKVRPALVVTPDNLLLHMDDVLCSFISSNMPEHMLTTHAHAIGLKSRSSRYGEVRSSGCTIR